MSTIEHSLLRACHGLRFKDGGLDVSHLKKMLRLHQPGRSVYTMGRKKLLDELCNKVCPMWDFVGAENIIKDIELSSTVYTYKGHVISPERTKLAEGGFGAVYEQVFYHEGHKYRFVEKHTKNILRGFEEVDVIQKYHIIFDCPGIIDMKLIGTDVGTGPIVIMPSADGDLSRYAGSLSAPQVTNILRVLKNALQCMHERHEKGIYYFDIKPANILFTCASMIKTEIYLADLGSIITVSEDTYVSTYPPPCARNGFIDLKDCDPSTVYTYQLAVLYCMLLTGKSGPGYDMTDSLYYTIMTNLARSAQQIVKGNKYSKILLRVARDHHTRNIPGSLRK